MPHLYENVRAKVKFQLTKGVERHAVTTDGWTSQSTIDYITLTVHFVTPDFKLETFVLQTRPLGQQHTADNLAEMLREAKAEWQLIDIFGVTDNAKNITKPFQDILQWPHLGCMGHKLNLSVVKCFSLPVVSKLLAKCRKFVGYFKRSTTAARCLKEKQKTLNLPSTSLINDCETRWNSTYDMLERLLVQEPAICATLMASSRRDDRSLSFTDSDISHMGDLVNVLASFKQVTTRLSSKTVATASLILPTLLKLLNVILKVNESDSAFVRDIKCTFKDDLNTRYREEKVRQFLQLAAFMDPRFKELSFLDSQTVEETLKLVHSECMAVAKRCLVPIKHESDPEIKQENSSSTTSSSLCGTHDSNHDSNALSSDFQSSQASNPDPFEVDFQSKRIKVEESNLTYDDFFC